MMSREGIKLQTLLVGLDQELQESTSRPGEEDTEQLELQTRLIGLDQELKESRAGHEGKTTTGMKQRIPLRD